MLTVVAPESSYLLCYAFILCIMYIHLLDTVALDDLYDVYLFCIMLCIVFFMIIVISSVLMSFIEKVAEINLNELE